jgi:hypothetical protein
MFLDILEKGRQKPRRMAPDPVLLARILKAAEDYDITGIDGAMEELEQCSYVSDSDLVAWLREQIAKSEFSEIRERLMAQEITLFREG